MAKNKRRDGFLAGNCEINISHQFFSYKLKDLIGVIGKLKKACNRSHMNAHDDANPHSSCIQMHISEHIFRAHAR